MFRFCFALCLAAAGTAQADITGPARIIDGDTLAIGATTIRLHGIDAPENGQPCRAGAETFDCGAWVTAQIDALYGGATLTCEAIETDRYGRIVATCFAGPTNLNAWIVSEGLALAFLRYSDAYALDEKNAALAGRGIHAFDLSTPAEYRAALNAAPAPTGTCMIKGNISDSGRIYHMPHNRDYGRTRIDAGRGERWFCTEEEARAAGWRAARN